MEGSSPCVFDPLLGAAHFCHCRRHRSVDSLSLSWRLGPQGGYKGSHIFVGATITVDIKSLVVRASPMESMEFVNTQVEDKIKKSIFRDIRRCYFKYRGICRSKEALIRSHVLAEHKELRSFSCRIAGCEKKVPL